jgi:uncharacterized protein
MTFLRALLFASALALGGAVPAASQNANTVPPSPEALQTAKELLSIMSGDMIADLSGKMIAQVWPSLEQALRAQYPKLDAPTLGELRAEFERLMAANITDAMKDAPAIYARYLSVPEMRDVQAFYRTPTGAKTLKLMPQITAEIMGTFLPRMQGLQQSVNAAFQTILQKHGFDTK